MLCVANNRTKSYTEFLSEFISYYYTYIASINFRKYQFTTIDIELIKLVKFIFFSREASNHWQNSNHLFPPIISPLDSILDAGIFIFFLTLTEPFHRYVIKSHPFFYLMVKYDEYYFYHKSNLTVF